MRAGRFAPPAQVTGTASCGVSSGRGVGLKVQVHSPSTARGQEKGQVAGVEGPGPLARLPYSHGVRSISLALFGAPAGSASVCPGPFIMPQTSNSTPRYLP